MWSEITLGLAEIFSASSTDGGLTFNTPVNVSNTPGSSEIPQIKAVEDNVYVVWEETITPTNDEIFFASSNNNGLTFGTSVNLSQNPGLSIGPQIAASDNNIYVVWYDNTPGNFEIFLIGNDQNFIGPVNLSNNDGSSISPHLTAIGENVYATWSDNSYGLFQIFLQGINQNLISPLNLLDAGGNSASNGAQITSR